MSYALLKQAIEAANVNHDAVFKFDEHTEVVAAQPVKQLIVSYQTGNEYLRLDRLLDELRGQGTVQVFELRGRGRDETSSLVADVSIGGKVFQLIYRLSDEAE